MTSVALGNGVRMPAIGLGTWDMRDGDEAERAVRCAIDAGYLLVDTAKLYGNERSVGKAVRECNVPREEIFVTTKLWPTDFFHPEKAFAESMARLDIGYVDLYLVHWPVPMMPKSVWRAMERIYRSGDAKAIGVSNFGIGDIEKLLDYCTVAPAVDQIKFSPFDFAEETLKCCAEHAIAVEAYSPLTRGSNLDDTTIGILAKKYGRTPAQVMLRWCIEHGTVPLPKSSDPARQRENLQVFDFHLSAEDVATLDGLS